MYSRLGRADEAQASYELALTIRYGEKNIEIPLFRILRKANSRA
jgi:hypothetical protein